MLLILLIFILIAAWAALVPFFLGLLVAYLLLPAVNFLDRHAPRFLRNRGWSRPLAIIIVYIAGIGIITGIISYFVPLVSQQAELLREAAPTLWKQIEELLAYDIEAQLERIPPQIRSTIDANIANATRTIATGIQRGLEVTLRTLSQTVSFILGLLIIPFWLFYVLNNQEQAKRRFFALVPESIREDVRCIITILDDLLGSYLRGQLLLCLIVGVMATIVLVVFGIEAAALLGTLAGILEIVPILGPWLGAVPAILIALIKRPILALWVALAFAGIQQIENVLLVPRISGNAVRFHPAVVMVLVLVGSELAGLWGLLVAVPVAAMLRDVVQYLFLRTTERGATPEMALESLRARTR
ncbi:MAG: AI-2E family transporter [Anaerolineae bacterium]|nr:AI-2E family transporter [Anaerolineae bacterium]